MAFSSSSSIIPIYSSSSPYNLSNDHFTHNTGHSGTGWVLEIEFHFSFAFHRNHNPLILWSRFALLSGLKKTDSEKDWGQEEKGMPEDEMVVWHHQLKGHEFEQAPGVGDGQGSLACCGPWCRKELDTIKQLNWTGKWHKDYLTLSSSLCNARTEYKVERGRK